ncbi:hybrid sensor histidine kinase/response regulator [Psychromonas arctica]|uniref:hybrid sensor histidine kinase/response regulator n=1 Tax=Psychromonas arctica TaxID=168275 RepID=UPI002FD138D4
MHQEISDTHQTRWQSLRHFNIVIMLSFIFFFLIGSGQSYSIFNSSPIFISSYHVPISILIFSIVALFGLVRKKDKLVHFIMPITCFSITLFVSINSHFQEQTYQNSFLYLVLLLPIFYSYLLAYKRAQLIFHNLFLVLCYVFTSLLGETSTLVFLFNSTFLISLSYLTIFTPHRPHNDQQIITEVKQESASLLSQQSALYLKRIVHDIRQPLSSLSLYGHLLENKLAGTAQEKLAKNIKLASEDLDRWMASLLDLARLDSGNITPKINEFSLASALSPSIKKYQHQALTSGIKLTSRLPELTIKSDKKLLAEVVEVLLSNALIHGQQTPGSKILLSVRDYKNKALLQVWNQGNQIPPTLFESLFDEVALAENLLHNKTKGVGLGLAVAQRKAFLCDTKIEVVTNQYGSRFSVMLETADHVTKHIDLNKFSNHSTRYKILLVDDDQGILNALSMLLENWGYIVDCEETAEAGLQKYYTNSYDLLITDYRLPNHKTGLDMIKEVKKKDNIPAILLTGEADPGKLKEVQDTGRIINYKILNKPVKPASLRFLLKQLLN